MRDITIEEFCDMHEACKNGREWAIKHCTSMQDAWNRLNPDWLVWVATRDGVLTDKELRFFAVWSARQVQHLMKDPRSLAALDVAEKHANGQASVEDLAAAWAAAWDAANAADNPAAWDSTWDAAWDAAWAATWAATWAAANAAAMAADNAAAWDSAWDADRAAANAAAWDAANAAAWDSARAAANAAARAADNAAAWAAARAAARVAQAQWLRQNTKPSFKEAKP